MIEGMETGVSNLAEHLVEVRNGYMECWGRSACPSAARMKHYLCRAEIEHKMHRFSNGRDRLLWHYDGNRAITSSSSVCQQTATHAT